MRWSEVACDRTALSAAAPSRRDLERAAMPASLAASTEATSCDRRAWRSSGIRARRGADPDGYVWEVAWGAFEIEEDGSLRIT